MRKIAVVLALAVACCFVLGSVAQAADTDKGKEWMRKNLKNKKKLIGIPIWQINVEGTKKSVYWVDHTPNLRFSIYDPATPEDDSDDLVLDKQTGLVWERSPDATTRTWEYAVDYCFRKEVAEQRGWRLPTIEELASLAGVDSNNPSVPTGHPFLNLQGGKYWSTTTDPSAVVDARYIVGVHEGLVGSDGLANNDYCWCVRGGQGQDGF
jgi:hypothetical protein